MHLLVRLERFEDFLRMNVVFLTRIIGHKTFGRIDNLLLPSRAAPDTKNSPELERAPKKDNKVQRIKR